MKTKSIIIGIFSSLVTVASLAQSQQALEFLVFKEERPGIAHEMSKASSVSGSQVFIKQVGMSNYARTVVAGENSRVEYRQEGDFNYINFDVQATNIEKVIHQNGNSNHAFGFMSQPSEAASLQLTQNGNQQHFEQFGSNSIGAKMQLKMNGNTNSIIVRNFK